MTPRDLLTTAPPQFLWFNDHPVSGSCSAAVSGASGARSLATKFDLAKRGADLGVGVGIEVEVEVEAKVGVGVDVRRVQEAVVGVRV